MPQGERKTGLFQAYKVDTLLILNNMFRKAK